MKRIEFIAPVVAMRGNISGKQDIVYPTNDNRAWDAPSDKREYARNYQPRFIGAKVAKNGKTYFAVRTKTAVKMTDAVRTQQAVLSVSSVIADIVRKDAALINQLQALFLANHPEGWSYKRWLMDNIKSGLKQKKTIVFPGYESLAAVYVKNPYISTIQPSSAVDISEYFPQELLAKFWMQLANNPITFTVAGSKGIAHAGDSFATLIDSNYNVLGLVVGDTIPDSGQKNVKLNDLNLNYVMEGVEYTSVNTRPIDHQGVGGGEGTPTPTDFILSDEIGTFAD